MNKYDKLDFFQINWRVKLRNIIQDTALDTHEHALKLHRVLKVRGKKFSLR